MSITSEHAVFFAKLKAATAGMSGLFDAAEPSVAASRPAAIPPRAHGPTGPRTEAGKKKSRLNSYKHGLTGQIHLFTPEEEAEFALHCKSIIDSLAPVGGLETTLAQTIAEGHWRLKRSRSHENTLYAAAQEETEPLSPDPQERRIDDAEIQLRAWIAQHKHISLLALYEGRIQRLIDRSMAELRTLRAERQAALAEEVLLAEFAESKGETYQPAHPEFVFSPQEIRRALIRKQRLEAVRSLPNAQLKTKK